SPPARDSAGTSPWERDSAGLSPWERDSAGGSPAAPDSAGSPPAAAIVPALDARTSPLADAARAARRRWLRLVAAVLAAGAVAWAVVVGRHTLGQSLAALGQLDFGWFVLGVGCEAVSLTAFGLSRRRLLRADGHQADFGSVMAITYAGNALSMSVPFAGAQLAAVFSYRQFRRRGLDPALTGWALGVSAIASSSALALILVAGAIAGGAALASAAGFAGAAIFGLPAVIVLLALRYPRARAVTNQILASAVHLARRVVRKPRIDPAALEEFLARLASIKLGWLNYAEVFGLAVVNWLADCACLACAIRATGSPVPWHGLLLAYGAGAVVGSTGATPGGFGLVEVAVTAALVATGMDASHALTAVLAYRLVSFWLILLGGGVTLLVLTRLREHGIRRYPRHLPRRSGVTAAPARS
ncbi:MAG TPA: YbhN family protein, partial [Streptosporangiaceae bacterium]